MMGTFSGTYTWARYSLLELQIKNYLIDATEISDYALNAVSKGLSKQYISIVIASGLFSNGDIGAEMRLRIDWRQHQLLLNSGGNNIRIPNNWKGGVSPTIVEACKVFNAACKDGGLIKAWSVVYDSRFNHDEINRELGFKPSPIRKWRKPPESTTLGFGPLEEMQLDIFLGL